MKLGKIAPSKLVLYHQNPRKGDLKQLKQSLAKNSQYKPVVVNRGTLTGRSMEVLGGNHTVMAIRELAEDHPADDRWRVVFYVEVDVDEDAAKRIVAADNRIGDLGGYDKDILTDLLGSLPDLDGTGFTDEDFQKMVAGAEPSDDGEVTETWDLVVECRSERQREDLMEQLESEGFSVRVKR